MRVIKRTTRFPRLLEDGVEAGIDGVLSNGFADGLIVLITSRIAGGRGLRVGVGGVVGMSCSVPGSHSYVKMLPLVEKVIALVRF